MKKLWTSREIDASAATLWELFTDLDAWATWGPSLRAAELDNDTFERGATGTLTTVAGVKLGFEVTGFEEGRFWAWNVAGVPSTHHKVETLGANRCRVGFGVPWVVAPYLAVCDIALRRLDTMATTKTGATQ